MVWAAFIQMEKLHLKFTLFKIKSAKYIQILRQNLLFYFYKFWQILLVYQQDNARTHVNKESNNWFESINL